MSTSAEDVDIYAKLKNVQVLAWYKGSEAVRVLVNVNLKFIFSLYRYKFNGIRLLAQFI